MRVGEIIGSGARRYKVVSDPSNSDGGRCMWAFATCAGEDYFVKQFLEPKYPTPDSMGSEKSKAARRTVCVEFENRHRQIMRKLAPGAPGSGNLVTAIDFFRQDTTYYKITHKISVESLDTLESLNLRERAVVLRTLCHSLQILHRQKIVHGDLKPTNVLIRKSSSGLHTAKLIDFDDSYVSGSPPPPDQIVGDSVYAAPEWFAYSAAEEGTPTANQLTTKIDIFALALLIHYYLTGELPGHGSHPAPALAVGNGAGLAFDARLQPRLRSLLTTMTQENIARRPDIKQVLSVLEAEAVLALAEPGATSASAGSSRRVRISMSSPGTPDEPAPRRPRSSRLRIKDLKTD